MAGGLDRFNTDIDTSGGSGSAIGSFLKSVTERMQKLTDLQMTSQANVATEVEKTRQTLPLEEASKIRIAQAEAEAKVTADPFSQFIFGSGGQPASSTSLMAGTPPQPTSDPFQRLTDLQKRLPPGVTVKSPSGLVSMAGPPQPKVLTPQQKAVEQNFRDLKGAIERIDATLASDQGFKGQLFRTGIPLQPGAGGLADEIQNAADMLLRMRSGAQINESEYVRLKTLLPTWQDAISERFGNPNRARNKLIKFKNSVDEILTNKAEGLGTDGEDLSQLSDEDLEAIVNGQ